MFIRPLALAFVAALAAPAFAAGVADLVEVDRPMVRAAAPGMTVSGAYMTVRNTDGTDHELVSAHSDVAENVELHTHAMEDGMMKMRRVDSVPLPANSEVAFEPGGLHIMLIGLARELNEGDSVEMVLEFEDGSRRDVTFEVGRGGH